ncbi:MAG: hypothetical protein K6D38_04975 [Pseudobutyrivibrio sp.]|nr:hypothetical protein [Pseudobutyrivibrio sp.]
MENLDFKNKVFIDGKAYRSFYIIGMIVTCIIAFATVVVSWIMGEEVFMFSMLVFVIYIIIFTCLSKITCANSAIFSMYDGVLYRINLPNQAGRDAAAMRGLGHFAGGETAGTLLAGATLVGEGSIRETQQNQLAEDENYLRETLSQEGYSFQILEVLWMKPFRNGYKVKMRCTCPGMFVESQKLSFYVFPGYNDYDLLIEYIKYFTTHKTEKTKW